MTILIYILAVIAAVWVIYDVWAVNKKLTTPSRLLWTVFALIFSLITAVVYLIIGRK